MIDSMTIRTVKRPSVDLPRPRARKALPPHPPAPVDDTTSGSREQPAETENTALPATRLPPETAEHRTGSLEIVGGRDAGDAAAAPTRKRLRECPGPRVPRICRRPRP